MLQNGGCSKLYLKCGVGIDAAQGGMLHKGVSYPTRGLAVRASV